MHDCVYHVIMRKPDREELRSLFSILPEELKEEAIENWAFWRLIYDGKMSYSDVSMMDEEELIEANYALDYYIDLLKESNKKGGK